MHTNLYLHTEANETQAQALETKPSSLSWLVCQGRWGHKAAVEARYCTTYIRANSTGASGLYSEPRSEGMKRTYVDFFKPYARTQRLGT